MKPFAAVGAGAQDMATLKDAKYLVYQRENGDFPSTNFAVADNPFAQDVLNAKSVLEIGCGCGRNVPWILENTSAKFYGVDPNKTMVETFKEFTQEMDQSRLYITNDFDEEICSRTYDFVITTFVFQHFTYRYPGCMDPTDIAKKAFELMHPGSVWFLLEHEGEDPGWQEKWFNEMGVRPDVYIQGYKGLPELNDRGLHNLLIFKIK